MGNKIKMAHEVPLSLLNDSLKFNDYQYVLPHLMDKYPIYNKFIKDYRKQKDSFIICDNGLFEGVEHTHEDLLDKIFEIEPDIFIPPDVWNDSVLTYKNARDWYNKKLPVDLMVVLQGETYDDMISIFQACYAIGYRYFAVNHSSISYEFHHPNKNKLISQMMGRIKFIHKLNNEINKHNYKDIYIHLLGASLPQEFVYYKEYPIIKSLDTSNPIIVGALGQRYNDYGLLTKPKEKIETFMESDLSSVLKDIKFNIHKFKSWINSQELSESLIGN